MTEPAPVADSENGARAARFGVFELDLHTHELRRDGIRINLQDQPFRLLTLLLDHAGDLVTREQLREQLWPNDFVDFDHSLNTAVRKLRTALDDSADNPRFVETLARRGYRFIAPVHWTGGNAQTVATPDEATPVAAPATVRHTRAPVFILAAGILIVAAIAGFFLYRSRAAVVPPVNSIAVLPFSNDDPRTAHVSDGLTEILIDTLARVPDLRVMARTTVFNLDRKTDARVAGQNLKVGAVVSGQINREDDGYRIHVELIDVSDGTQIWGNQYRAAANELPSVQSRISGDLSHELRRGFGRDRRLLVTHGYTRNAEAYDLYLKGLYAFNKRGATALRESVELFKKAADADPEFAAAYAGLANSYGVMLGNGLLTYETGIPMIMSSARKALQLDPDNAEAYVSIATTEFRNMWDFAAAERGYKRGLLLNPNYVTGHQWYGDYLRSMGRFDEARREVETAYRLDPLSRPINVVMCWTFFFERRYAEGIAFLRDVSDADSRRWAQLCTATSFLALGDYKSAFEITPGAEAGPGAASWSQYAAAYKRGGPRALYEARIEDLKRSQSANQSTPVQIAEFYSLLGRSDEAFEWLEKGYQQRSSRITNMNIAPAFDPIRNDPRFEDLRKRIGLPKVTLPGPEMKVVQ